LIRERSYVLAGLEDILGRIQNAWNSFSFSQKIVISGIVAAVIVSLVIFSFWLRKPSFGVLFSDLDVASAGDVSEELEKMGVDYKVEGGGTTILVPAERIAQLRINLASEGVINSGGVGYEIFDNNEIGVTDFVQKINMRRALEGELSRTISSLNAVEKARVHIVFPKVSIFKDKSREATASVVVRLRRGRKLSDQQVNGISNLVSFSVEGLESGNVTVIDQSGNTLSQSSSEEALGMDNAMIGIKRKLENYLSKKAEDMLSSVLGPGRAIVRVDAEIDYRNIETMRESYDPNTVVRSEEVSTESNTQEGSSSENIISNYEVNRTVETIVGNGGGIKSLSVAAFVDGHYEEGEGGKREYQPLSDQEVNELRDVIKSAVGFDPSRNDVIKVVNLPFYSGNAGSTDISTPLVEWLPEVLAKLAAAGILVFLFLMFRKNIGKLLSGGGGFPSFARAKTGGGGGLSGVPKREPSLEERTREVSMEEPEQVVKLVKTWMSEE
jgi:flagellar M-ring protein FliF